MSRTLNILIDVAIHRPSFERLTSSDGARVHVTLNNEDEDAAVVADDLLAELDVAFCTFPPVDHERMARLKLVQIGSAGYTQLRGLKLPERGVRACNGSGVFDTSIAEWNIAMIINLARNLRQQIRNQEAGIWDRCNARFQQSVRDSVVGLWGYGGLARQTARLCKAMGLTVHALTRDGAHPRPNTYVVPGSGDPEAVLPDRVFTPPDTKAFLGGLDFLIVCLPLNADTEGIIGEAELRALPEHAMVLNPARGPLIQEAALLGALREGRIAGAALDAHYRYPMPADHPLWRFPNVIMTAHISGSNLSASYPIRIWDIFLQNLQRFRAGEPLLNELTPAQLA